MRKSRENGLFKDVPDHLWNDWHWQVENRIETLDQLKQHITLTPEEEEGVATTLGKLRMSITPYYLSLIDLNDPFDPTVKHQILHRTADGRRYAVVATTRPETIMGDTAMCINPKDPKNSWLKGKRVIVPLVGRSIPVIEDRYVEIEFGTGCLKVTPAHDTNDYMLGKKHNLDTIDIFNPDATLSEAAGLYIGMDRMEVRKQIVKDLEAAGLMEKVEDYINKVGYSERNADTAVEPRLCMQWFLSMQHFADIALPPVMEDRLKFYPTKYKTTYKNWLENIQDWCISRQLWWGHRIPAYYLPTAEGKEEQFVVAMNREEALQKARQIAGFENITAEELRHDEDALDTWFSSWLWPVSLFNGILDPGNEEINYYYPTADLVTGPDIIFFWVARMIMAGEEYLKDVPFRNVYFTGIVRDNLGRKMSKQLGNSPDPIGLIEKYGADGVRMGMLLAAPAGNDILFDESLCGQGAAFCNKIWNAFRLVKGWEISDEIAQPEHSAKAIEWMQAQLRTFVAEINDLYSKYRLNEALMAMFKLFTDEFSGWYLEMIKPAYQAPIDRKTLESTMEIFEQLMKIIHPFMPFITEEIWQSLPHTGDSIMISDYPKYCEELNFTEDEERMASLIATIRAIRNLRSEMNVPPSKKAALTIVSERTDIYNEKTEAFFVKLASASSLTVLSEYHDDKSVQTVTENAVVYLPLAEMIDFEKELARLEGEKKNTLFEIERLEKKLSNEGFVAKAPAAVIEGERAKLAKYLETRSSLTEALAKLG